MKLWIAKDEGATYCKLFKYKPYKVYDRFIKKYSWVTEDMLGTYMCIKDDSINSITFENSPQQVELKLVSEIVSIAESPSKTFPRVNDFEVGASYRR